MGINKVVVERKLSKLKEFIRRIEGGEFGEEEFFENVDIQDLLVFRLMQCVEIAIDIAAHLVAAHELPMPESAKEMFLTLGKKKILSTDVAETMSNAVGFRNLAAHEYDEPEFNIKVVFRDYKSDILDLKRFAKEVVEVLEGEKKS